MSSEPSYSSHRRGDRKQMCVSRGLFAHLATVNVGGVQQGSIKSIG